MKEAQAWQIIFDTNLDTVSAFSLANQGDTSNTQKDSSWFLLFTTNTETYTITERASRYVFESESEISFYFDNSVKIYDAVLGKTINDVVNILSINTQPNNTVPFTVDMPWQIVSEYLGQDGYIDPKKVKISLYDYNNLGQIIDPDTFDNIVASSILSNITGYKDKFVYYMNKIANDYLANFRQITSANIELEKRIENLKNIFALEKDVNKNALKNNFLNKLNNF